MGVMEPSFKIFGNTPFSKNQLKNPLVWPESKAEHFFKTVTEISLALPFSNSLMIFSAIGSAEDLPPRFRPNPRGNARTPPGSARIRADSRESAAEVLPPSQ